MKKKNEYLRVLGTKTDQNLEQINTLFLRVVELERENKRLKQLVAKTIIILRKGLK